MAATKLPKTIGATVDALDRLRDEIKKVNNALGDLKQQKAELEDHFIELAEAQDMVKATGKRATASIGEDEITKVEDWNTFYKFISRQNAFYLLERRPSQVACRELRPTRRGRSIPGTSTFLKRKINLTTLKPDVGSKSYPHLKGK